MIRSFWDSHVERITLAVPRTCWVNGEMFGDPPIKEYGFKYFSQKISKRPASGIQKTIIHYAKESPMYAVRFTNFGTFLRGNFSDFAIDLGEADLFLTVPQALHALSLRMLHAGSVSKNIYSPMQPIDILEVVPTSASLRLTKDGEQPTHHVIQVSHRPPFNNRLPAYLSDSEFRRALDQANLYSVTNDGKEGIDALRRYLAFASQRVESMDISMPGVIRTPAGRSIVRVL